MQRYQTFTFTSYDFAPETGVIRLRYALDNAIHFEETLTLPEELRGRTPRSPAALDAALFALHLIGGVSYYKTFCPPHITVQSGTLDAAQADFWNTVYTHGLGEFFYKNTIDFRGLVEFPVTAALPRPSAPSRTTDSACRLHSRHLVPLGGGKDSIVTIELLRNCGADVTLLRVGQKHPLIDRLVTEIGLPCIHIKRTLAPELFALNAEGALNGHIPITAYIAFLSAVTAELGNFGTIAMSNERSASVGNVVYRGEEINHQWSKGVAFESLFRQYLREHIDPGLCYENLLRPMSELQVTKVFSNFPQYFNVVTSCNRNWRLAGSTGTAASSVAQGSTSSPTSSQTSSPTYTKTSHLWCGECPKCAFVFALFAAFLPRRQLEQIFGKNLFADITLLPLYSELLGIEGRKPFECVGTPEETRAAFALAHKNGEWADTTMMQMFVAKVLPEIEDPGFLVSEVLLPTQMRRSQTPTHAHS